MPRQKAGATDRKALDPKTAAAELDALPPLLSPAQKRALEVQERKDTAAKFLSDIRPSIRRLSERGYPAPHIARLLREKHGISVKGDDITELLGVLTPATDPAVEQPVDPATQPAVDPVAEPVSKTAKASAQ